MLWLGLTQGTLRLLVLPAEPRALSLPRKLARLRDLDVYLPAVKWEAHLA